MMPARVFPPWLLAGWLLLAGCDTGLSDLPGSADAAGGGAVDAAAVAPGADATSSGREDLEGSPADLAGAAAEQVPPTGRVALEAWLAGGDYKRWHCEAAPHAARPPGAHGENRICSNDALSSSAGPGDYPVGSASVKELYSNGALLGYAVALRRSAGAGGAHWYWYERSGNTVFADGDGVGLCTGCHNGAPRDEVFTQVK